MAACAPRVLQRSFSAREDLLDALSTRTTASSGT
jgi:hypothetical protein